MKGAEAFDRSLLPEALAEIVILADTHHTRPDDPSTVEFASRKLQAVRARKAFELAATLKADSMIHLGDLIQDYPDGSGFEQAFRSVSEDLIERHPKMRLVAGNHDVGDKPDARMPTHATTASSLALFHRNWGRSWYRFRVGETAAYVLNTQIMNTGLAASRHQWTWFERALRAETRERLLLFLHLPPYLSSADEPDIGHYDNLGEPDRTRLLRLVRKYRFEAVFAGHVHYRFFDRIGHSRYFTLGSPSFTRPGFGHLYTSGPPPERGRDDRPKLGFSLLRIHSKGIALHWIRTETGQATTPRSHHRRVLTPVSSEIEGSPLGFTLCHALASRHEIPLAWPSTIRQAIRNDQPFLGLVEMGCGWIRTTWRDFLDPLQGPRLKELRSEGIATCAFVDLPEIDAFLKHSIDLRKKLSAVELRLAAGEAIVPSIARRLAALTKGRLKLILSPILPGQAVPGKQHPRTRTAWTVDELPAIQDEVSRLGLRVDRWRVLCPVESLEQGQESGLDLVTEFTDDDGSNLLDASWGLAQVTAGFDCRLSLYPLRDLDRTMDLHHGALDTLCNPRTVFTVLRLLNAILVAARKGQQKPLVLEGSKTGWTLTESGGGTYRFIHATRGTARRTIRLKPSTSPSRVYNLQEGTVKLLAKQQTRIQLPPGIHLVASSCA